jgi:AcrR family transcriptional regulator
MTTPREKRHDITRQRILDTSRKIISAQGLEGFSIRNLAEQIDYSPSAIYKYFDSKEEILQAIRTEFWELSQRNQMDLSGLTPPQKLITAGKNYLAFADKYPEHYKLVFNSPDLQTSGVTEIKNDPRFSGLIALVQEGVETGYFKLPDGYTSESMAVQLWISVHGIAMMRLTIMQAFRAEFDPLAEKIMEDFIRSFTVR